MKFTWIRLLVGALVLTGIGLVHESRGQVARGNHPGPNPLAEFLQVPNPELDDGELAGMAKGSPPQKITWKQVYLLALLDAERRKRGEVGLQDSLDMKTLEARERERGLLDFAKLRDVLIDSAGRDDGFRDPAARTLDLLAQLQLIENAHCSVAEAEVIFRIMVKLIQGEVAGISQLDVDRVSSSLQDRRSKLIERLMGYRDSLDVWKTELGFSPRLRVGLDRSSLKAFHEAVFAIHRWYGNPGRRLDELPSIAQRLPTLEDLMIEGRFLVSAKGRPPAELAELLDDAASLAIRNRKARGGVGQRESEDELELRVRRLIRRLILTHTNYEIERRNLILLMRQKDQWLEQLIAPPGDRLAMMGQNVENLLVIQQSILKTQDSLVRLWASFTADRSMLCRDLGKVPYPDLLSYLEGFVARPTDESVVGDDALLMPPPPGGPVQAAPPASPAPRPAAPPAPPAPGPGRP